MSNNWWLMWVIVVAVCIYGALECACCDVVDTLSKSRLLIIIIVWLLCAYRFFEIAIRCAVSVQSNQTNSSLQLLTYSTSLKITSWTILKNGYHRKVAKDLRQLHLQTYQSLAIKATGLPRHLQQGSLPQVVEVLIWHLNLVVYHLEVALTSLMVLLQWVQFHQLTHWASEQG